MTPREAEDVFYAAYNRWLAGRDFDRPLVQAEGRAYAWGCAVAAIAARETRRAEWWADAAMVAACVGVVAGYLVAKVFG